MPKFIINWDAGYGKTYRVVEANSKDEALDMAGEEWQQEAESNADFGVDDYSEELASEVGADHDL